MAGANQHPRVLVAIPAYNEGQTIAQVVRSVRVAAPQFDLLVVNDGSTDETGDVLKDLGVRTATHLCNLGYGRALQTAIKCATRSGYDAIITFDADGQHAAEDVLRLHDAFLRGGHDLLIGSRFINRRSYRSEPLARRLGMYFFSVLIALVSGQRIYDTSSGFKVIGRHVFGAFTECPFVDFHAEAMSYLIGSGYRVAEFAISVGPRQHGESMYDALSAVKYPLKVSFLILIGAWEARRTRSRRRG